MNRYVPHAFSPAPFPDPDCPPHFYAHGENPTYLAFGELMAYSNRICHLIDGGRACPDVAVLYAAESIWSGEGSSNIPVCRNLTQEQVDFHIIPADVFAEDGEYDTRFDGIKLTVNHVEYSALVISGCTFIEEKTASFVEKAVKKGFLVVFADQKPVGIVKASQRENAAFVKMIAHCPVVLSNEMGAFIKNQKSLDLQVTVSPANKRLTTYHYQLDDTEEFLILNEMAEETYQGEVTVKAQGIPIRYLPWENRLEKVAYEKLSDGKAKLQLSIAPLELCVIIFLNENAQFRQIAEEIKPQKRQGKHVLTISEFRVGRVDAPDYYGQLAQAKSGLYPGKAVVKAAETECVTAPFTGMQRMYPDYSGFYIYETKVILEKGREYQLELDDVYETAEVFWNGKSLGTKIQRPYSYMIPQELICNENELRIEVATLLERKVKAMGAGINGMSAERPMSPTGIVGDVVIHDLSQTDCL